MTILLETIALPASGILDIDIRVKSTIQVTAERARRQVSVFVGNQIGDLLHGEEPTLVLRGQSVYWRVPVALSSPTHGRIGTVGTLDVHTETGQLELNEQTILTLKNNAHRQ